LVIDGQEGKSWRVNLEQGRYRLGRSTSNEFCFPEDGRLSREHLVFEAVNGRWSVRDLGSRNGTLVNGSRITDVRALVNGDLIKVGHLNIIFLEANSDRPQEDDPVAFVDELPSDGLEIAAVSTDLKSVLAGRAFGVVNSTEHSHLAAFVRASRELVSHRPLQELFQVILDISVDAVRAFRGVLVLRDYGKLRVHAHHGEGFRISTAVVSRVLDDRASLLIVDAAKDASLAGRESILMGQVRSILAVPLQTDERVLGLIYIDSPQGAREFTTEDLSLLTVMASIAAIRIEQARLLEVEQAEKLLAGELAQAGEIQRSLLPLSPPELAGFDLAAYNMACRTVGGDYYDFVSFPDGRLLFLVADVAGKGMSAALLMSSLHAFVQVIFEDADHLGRHFERLNRSVTRTCPRNRFITLFAATLDPASGQLCFCNAGHNPPLLLRANDEVEPLNATGTVLGFSPESRYEERCCKMSEGDLIVLFSDGVTEACGSNLEMDFGEDRLVAVLRENRHASAACIVDAVKCALADFTGGVPPADDITLVVARRVQLDLYHDTGR
jgi:serine phosphatase RsbU (regulator of sigma subunit)